VGQRSNASVFELPTRKLRYRLDVDGDFGRAGALAFLARRLAASDRGRNG
jgi:hypothetical protein